MIMDKGFADKRDCQIARDLMPLCADKAASEGSKAFVNEHMAECRECAAYYQGMMSRFPVKTDAERRDERQEFGRVTRRLKRSRRLRIILIFLAALLLGYTVMYTGPRIYQAYVNASESADLSLYDLSLCQLRDGRVVISIIYLDDGAPWCGGWNARHQNGKLYIWAETLRHSDAGHLVTNRPVYTIQPAQLSSAAVYKGEPSIGKNELVWRFGDDLPAASEEMEAYYKMKDFCEKADALTSRLLDGVSYLDTDDGTIITNYSVAAAHLEVISMQCNYLFTLVPEWQPYTPGAFMGFPQNQTQLEQSISYFNVLISGQAESVYPLTTALPAATVYPQVFSSPTPIPAHTAEP